MEQSALIMKNFLFFILIISAFSFATSVKVRKFIGDSGFCITRTYKTGNYSFGWKIPPHWAENLNPTGNTALVFAPLETNAVTLSLYVTPVSLAESKVEKWRANDLKKQLMKNRLFDIINESYSPVDDTKALLLTGVETIEIPQTNDTVVLKKNLEMHSFHINQGYLIHICFKSPLDLAGRYSKVFNNSLWCFYTVKDDYERDPYIKEITDEQ